MPERPAVQPPPRPKPTLRSCQYHGFSWTECFTCLVAKAVNTALIDHDTAWSEYHESKMGPMEQRVEELETVEEAHHILNGSLMVELSRQNQRRRVCAWCGTVLSEGYEPPTHGMCLDCKAKALDEIKRQKEAER